MQEHILRKTQGMLDERLIRGTFENGTEYTVLSTILGMSKEILRLIRKNRADVTLIPLSCNRRLYTPANSFSQAPASI